MEHDQHENETGVDSTAQRMPVEGVPVGDAHFFWDPAAFRVLTNKVLPHLLEDRLPEDPIRIWVPGCATGEDVYSIGIALLEFLLTQSISIPIRIFGSDLSETHLGQARSALYSESIGQDVLPHLLGKYFTRSGSGYRVAAPLREQCIFARQDVTRDAPFAKVDLISCRDLLGRLNPSLRRKALENLFYALKPGGHLLIGAAEDVPLPADWFCPVDEQQKLYSKTLYPRPRKVARILPSATLAADIKANPDVGHEADRIALARYAPPGIVVNADRKILQCRGRVGRFLELAPGELGLRARPGLARALRTSLDRASRTNEPERREGLRMSYEGSTVTVALEVIPFRKPGFPEPYFLVLFDDTAPDPPKRSVHGRRSSTELRWLRREMAAVKQRMESTIEELQSHIEELTSTNSEVQLGNEELQSFNEELEAARTELQCANQELATFNAQLSRDNRQLVESNDDLSNLLSSVELPVVIVDENFCLRRFTPAAGRLLNLIPRDIGRPILDFKPRVEVPDLESLFHDVFDHLHVVEREVRDEEGRSYSMCLRPYRTRGARIAGVLMVLSEITSPKRMSALRPAEYAQESQAFSEFLRQVPVGILWSDTEGQCSFANAEACRIAGVTPEQALGRGWTKNIHPEDQPLLGPTGERSFFHAEKCSHDIRFQSENGTTAWAHRISIRMYRQDGSVRGYFSTIADITERKHLEEQLTQSQKMEAIGCLAGGIAHDFNNILTAISGYAAELLSALPTSHPGRKAAEQIGKVGDQAGLLTKQLLAISRRQVVRPSPLNLNGVLRDMDDLLRRLLGETIEIAYSFEPELGTVVLDLGQAQQVILNLAINARDAMAQGGRLTLSTGHVFVDPKNVPTNSLPPGAYVALTARDTGAGMGAATRERVFEPFFTTKPPGYGTGLGLSMVYGIVQQSGGGISLESELGKGATLRILFPRSDDHVEPAVQPIHRPVSGGHETILLVEDSGVVRSLIMQALSQRGYKVLEASDGAEALLISDKHEGPIHLLLTDLLMPRMSGDQLGRRIRRRRRRIKVIYMSGYSGEAFHAVKREANFLEKPFHPEHLAESIRKVLDE